ncbi:MAG: glycosyltransferase family 9 protein [Phycisphaerales bacterium]|nr:glycosyltransferase family 9 protein [Phycisphaerales bacterium]
MNQQPRIPAQRIVVIMPNWLGDAVMATPFLYALRQLYPQSHIAGLANSLAMPVLSGLSLLDAAISYPPRPGKKKSSIAATAALLRREHFDLAVILPNSLRSALAVWQANVPRRLGYAREYRSLLLTDTLCPKHRCDNDLDLQWARNFARRLIENRTKALAHKATSNTRAQARKTPPDCVSLEPAAGHAHRFNFLMHHDDGSSFTQRGHFGPLQRPLARYHNYQPAPVIDYYLQLAGYLGSNEQSRTLRLGVTEGERAEAQSALAAMGIGSQQPYAMVFPGANFGSSKCWPAERFAEVSARISNPAGPIAARVIIAGSPAERPLIDAILRNAINQSDMSVLNRQIVPLAAVHDGRGVSLGAVKALVRQAALMLCNDTGPRHFAAAFGVPLVTLFGPTDPRWAEIFYVGERQLSVPVPCGPCQLKRCPIDHRCMRAIGVEQVWKTVLEQWQRTQP